MNHHYESGRFCQFEDSNLASFMDTRLSQRSIARSCKAWLEGKAQIKPTVKPSSPHRKLYHIRQKNMMGKAVAGSSK